jgi:poly(hydroxyalkanoate) depolymerase family esterase
MRGISDTIARLAASAAKTGAYHDNEPARLTELREFGSNAGALRAFVYIPDDMPDNAPLVVVLHGCTQTAAGYDRASGWSQLADEHGFALLYPEQQRSNNANGCFNWFDGRDTKRDRGEAFSIREMVAAVQGKHAIDPSRVFVTGLSAGGAMSATMLAAYPEVFAGGAIIAGLPHGVATGMVQAFDRMRGHGLPDAKELQKIVHRSSDHRGRWPTVSIWHGDADHTVSVRNVEALLAQWRGVHGLDEAPSDVDRVDGAAHRAWRDAQGEVRVEAYIVPGMGHGTPLRTSGEGACGRAAPYMLDVGISSTTRIAQRWGIIRDADALHAKAHALTHRATYAPAYGEPRRLHGRRIETPLPRAVSGVGKVIEDALRAAGLMK